MTFNVGLWLWPLDGNYFWKLHADMNIVAKVWQTERRMDNRVQSCFVAPSDFVILGII